MFFPSGDQIGPPTELVVLVRLVHGELEAKGAQMPRLQLAQALPLPGDPPLERGDPRPQFSDDGIAFAATGTVRFAHDPVIFQHSANPQSSKRGA